MLTFTSLTQNFLLISFASYKVCSLFVTRFFVSELFWSHISRLSLSSKFVSHFGLTPPGSNPQTTKQNKILHLSIYPITSPHRVSPKQKYTQYDHHHSYMNSSVFEYRPYVPFSDDVIRFTLYYSTLLLSSQNMYTKLTNVRKKYRKPLDVPQLVNTPILSTNRMSYE